MDVMRPELIWVGDRCYRKNPSQNDYGIVRQNSTGFTGNCEQEVAPENANNGHGQGQPPLAGGSRSTIRQPNNPKASSSKQPPPYVEADLYDCCEPIDAPDALLDEIEFPIEKLGEDGFKSRCDNIPSGLFSVIIGMKGATKKRIESETNTKIIIPRMNEPGSCVVRGQTRQNVVSARRRIEMLTSQARFRREATHFASFPLNLSHIVEKVSEFKEKVLNDCKGNGIEENIFQEPAKIHLTICVMMLLEQRERQLAQEILEKIKPDISQILSSSKKLKFRLQGLEIMNDDPTEVNVLYAKCIWEDADAAQKLADFICAKFVDSGLGKPNRGTNVKFHATLMKTRHRQSQGAPDNNGGQQEQRSGNAGSSGNASRGGKPNAKDFFDARAILKKFGDFDFGAGQINEIHLSTRHTNAPNGFYKFLTKIVL